MTYYIKLGGWAGREETHTSLPPGMRADTEVTKQPWLWTSELQAKLGRYDKQAAIKAGVRVFTLAQSD